MGNRSSGTTKLRRQKILLSGDATITQLVCFSSLFHTSSTHACTHHRRGKKQQRETGNTPREYPQAKCLLQRQFRGQSLQRTAKMPSSSTTKMENQIDAQWVCSTESDSMLWGGHLTGCVASSREASATEVATLCKLGAREAQREEGRRTPPFLDVCAHQANSPSHFKPRTK